MASYINSSNTENSLSQKHELIDIFDLIDNIYKEKDSLSFEEQK